MNRKIREGTVLDGKYCNKLKLQKKGLIHDLLTGKVRVKVDTPEEDAPP